MKIRFAAIRLGLGALACSTLIACAGSTKSQSTAVIATTSQNDEYGEAKSERSVPYDLSEEPLATSGDASLKDTWWTQELACPVGAKLHGGVPPEHSLVGCKTAQGKNVGRLTEFYPDGAKKEEGQYADHFAEGVWTLWDSKGNRIEETTYVHGKKEGVQTKWYPSGEIKTQRPYRGGMRHGTTNIWDERARKRTAIPYVDGVENGPEARWSIEGELVRVIDWRDGEKAAD